jgi:hypothetical protein
LRAILEDYGHVVEVNAYTARQILNNSVKRGIELGRLKTGTGINYTIFNANCRMKRCCFL